MTGIKGPGPVPAEPMQGLGETIGEPRRSPVEQDVAFADRLEMLSLMAEVRSKLVEGYQELVRMQL